MYIHYSIFKTITFKYNLFWKSRFQLNVNRYAKKYLKFKLFKMELFSLFDSLPILWTNI